MPDIIVKNFKKSYNGIPAVDGISFAIEKGELFGLIGPDGAGKTTLIRTISTLLFPSEGTVFVKEMNITTQIAEIP